MKSWKKRALALTMAALVVLSGCTFPFGQGNDGDGAPVDNVDVSDAYSVWRGIARVQRSIRSWTAPRSTACCVRRFTRAFLR